jgi:hypothetical protein
MTVRFVARTRAHSRSSAFKLITTPFLLSTLLLSALGAHAVPGTVPWTANDGQWRPEVVFRAQAAGVEAWLLRDGALMYRIARPGGDVLLGETLVGAARSAPRGGVAASTRVGFFLGADRDRWRPDLPTWQALDLAGIYPGIDLRLRIADGPVEKVFAVHPGANTDTIRFAMTGHETLAVDADGTLVAGAAGGGIRHSAPIAWQDIEGTRKVVPSAWRKIDDAHYGFAIGDYDRRHLLHIDPLIQATFLGGGGDDPATMLLHPTNGDLYVVGSTDSTDLPGTAGAFQPAAAGTGDLFIARLDPGLTTLHRITYLGGTANEFLSDVRVAANGDLVLAGNTVSADFPGVTGSAQATYGGGFAIGDAFVARVNADLTTLVRSTYFGGTADEQLAAISIDPGGDIFIAGTTASSDLPGTTGGAQATSADTGPAFGPGEGFIARVAADLTSVVRATYVGGSLTEMVSALEVRPAGVYLAGATSSQNFPGLAGGAQTIRGGSQDAFVALFSADLTTRTQATLLGGSGYEVGPEITFIGNNLYVAGATQSTNFPGVAGGAQPVYGGGDDTAIDIFITLLNPGLTAITQSTYLGGSGFDLGFLSPEGVEFLYVSGSTNSADFPGTAGGAQPDYAGGSDAGGDAFATILNLGLTTLIQSTYLGGGGDDFGFLSLASGGNVYLSGTTNSADFPGVTGGVQSTFGGQGASQSGDAFASLLSGNLQTLIQSTYYGGSGDEGGGVIPAGDGNIYIAGSTSSATLLGTDGGIQASNAGGEDHFIALLGGDLTGYGGGGGGTPGPLVAAVLPGSRAVGIGVPASAFGLMINAGTATATGCNIAPVTAVTAAFNYQTTDPATNALVGTPNTPVDIPAGAAQTYVFDFNPGAAFGPTVIQLAFDCSNTSPAAVTPGVNTFTMTASTVPGPDVIAIALTPTNNGIASLPSTNGAVAFAVATANVGATGSVNVSTNTGGANLGLANFICETDAGANCLAAPAATVTTTMNTGSTTQFSVFLNASTAIAADPAVNRVNVIFESAGTQVGSTSVATQTP